MFNYRNVGYILYVFDSVWFLSMYLWFVHIEYIM